MLSLIIDARRMPEISLNSQLHKLDIHKYKSIIEVTLQILFNRNLNPTSLIGLSPY